MTIGPEGEPDSQIVEFAINAIRTLVQHTQGIKERERDRERERERREGGRERERQKVRKRERVVNLSVPFYLSF
jgi:hypothetical protein